ncbi:hypothetical protein C0Q70_14592 [Pomacea canaliculata]|uniref:VWFA domain-containing protein n=1 Tax=Pomacea canaliculata TaxID=400727 RepID=A0A2T7NSJ6_POMCA|nr:hypothetical protein C0Q70_14592 [Pomacea canaliculata]
MLLSIVYPASIQVPQELKAAAETAMKRYGPYPEDIKFEDVQYYNAKKVVIEADMTGMDDEAQDKIKQTIDYLPTEKAWDFRANHVFLNMNISTVHVPTNIYDKSEKILNGVKWTDALTQQFKVNAQNNSALTWQYFCSSDGFFRIFPGMQWPRDPDTVDVFDCRMQKWYIQAATTPKNIIILVDTSGSMMGKRMAIAQSTVSTILETLSDEDYFNIIKYSKEPEYVDSCFNGTIMPANVDNIRRMQQKINDITTKDAADLRKALILAFQLLKQEERQMNSNTSTVCNKAIMIITDGAPENYVDVYKEYNWPNKSVRIFTYLIGKEVPDDRKIQWMACVNKGEFTHISTRADVQENVQQYIKVLSRPMAQNKSTHFVWSAVYLDYPTQMSEISVNPMSFISNRINAEYEQDASFKGLGLVISVAMPVFDTRTVVLLDFPNTITTTTTHSEPPSVLRGPRSRPLLLLDTAVCEETLAQPSMRQDTHDVVVLDAHNDYHNLSRDYLWNMSFSRSCLVVNVFQAKCEEDPTKNLLGVVGTDVRCARAECLSSCLQLGVNGYAFAVTSHGYVLFHPDFRPFHNIKNTNRLALRPKYNSVDLSEVELIFSNQTNHNHPLRQYLLSADDGSDNMENHTMLMHYDGMKRARTQKNNYQFGAINKTFRLVFVVPDGYGNHYIKVKDKAVQHPEQDFALLFNGSSKVHFAPWIYCQDTKGSFVQLDEEVLYEYVKQEFSNTPGDKKFMYDCDKELVRHLLLDIRLTVNYSNIWNGISFVPKSEDSEDPVGKENRKCLLANRDDKFRCITMLYKKYGIEMMWVSTASGLTRYNQTTHDQPAELEFMQMSLMDNRYRASIKSLYYRRAVYGWEEGTPYVFFLEKSRGQRYVVMAVAEIGEGEKNAKTPIAVTAFLMKHYKLQELFSNLTGDCPDKHNCKVTCADTHILNCYLVDNNGYVLASNNPENETLDFLGEKEPSLLRELIRHHYFIELNVTDYQAICPIVVSHQQSSSSFLMTPFKYLLNMFSWILMELALFLSEWGLRSWLHWRSAFGQNSGYDAEDCASKPEDMDPVAQFYLCNVVVYKDTKELLNNTKEVDNRPCVTQKTRYSLNVTTMKAKKSFSGSLTRCGQCNAANMTSYTVQWLEDTNLILVMAAANCECDTTEDSFPTAAREVTYILPPQNTLTQCLHGEEEMCKRLLNVSLELKMVDTSRTTNALCLDSRDEVLRIDSAIEPSTFFTPPTTVVSSAPTSLPAAALQKESSHGWLHTELPSITSEARLCSDSLGLEKKQEGEKWRHAGHGPACCVIFIRI